MEHSFGVYSVAQAVRGGGVAPVRQALLAARQRTLAQVDAWERALGDGLQVPLSATLNPPLWEWGHIGWFQDRWIARNRQRGLGIRCDPDHPLDASALPQADALYDSSRVAHTTRWDLALPDRDATLAYLDAVLRRTLACLDALGTGPSHDELYFFRLVALHEEMHAEAGMYMGRAFGIPVPGTSRRAPRAPDDVLGVPAQAFRVGHDGPGFAFDNELGAHDVALPAFEIDARPVSWRRFQAFVDAGGYAQPRWWSEEGWHWRSRERTVPPAAGPAAADDPAVHLSAHEAHAWCRWAGRRLPSEAEWECAAVTVPGFAWGEVWEWTASAFEPYDGFAAHPYRDYSAPWFGSRQVLRGACSATAASLAHPRYRNFFEPHRTDVFAGFRSCA